MLLPLAALLLLAGPPAEPEIRALDDRRMKAMVDADVETLRSILHDDLTYVHTRAGELETKAEFLQRLKTGDLDYKSMRKEEVRVRVMDCMALVTGRLFADVRSHGQDLSLQVRFTAAYSRQGDAWQLVAWQSTRIP
ncbi:MAG TPA: nuclear transport factor 2 family protein [Vicinamibacteria bacterium]|nr:nuclear transport factor 2 family protein [Vicinamibacteria bacterium]